MRTRSGFFAYVKAAFLWHWNLLAVGAGAAFAILSGQPDKVLPLLGAAEILYLGLLTTRPHFQKAIDARGSLPENQPVDDLKVLERIKSQLKPDVWARFEELRQRCLSLSRLAEQVRGPQNGESTGVQDMQTQSLERLLWMFLKLVYSHDALQRFLQGTDHNLLGKQLTAAEQELKDAASHERSDKLLRSIEDKITTLKQRISNYEKTEENRELVAAEIDRIEQKVNAISELSISARDPADVSAQVDGIAEGVSMTEEAIRKLDVPPLFESQTAPRFLTQNE
jgi:hypothetical protein